MNKKLLVVAVAGALAAPGVALAQSSVTISGIFKASLENVRIGSPNVTAGNTVSNGAGLPVNFLNRTGLNTTENRVADDSSRILFNVVEDLGGGLAAIGQADLRMPLASGNAIFMSGNTHVGLRSKSLGRILVGRQDVHYGNTESDMSALAGDLRADAVSLLAFMKDGTAIAGATRTPNIIHYTTPNFSGFTAIVAYSTGPTAASGTGATGQVLTSAAQPVVQQSDLATGARKGSAINFNPNYAAANWQVGYSYWNSKPDLAAATQSGTGAAVTSASSGASFGTADQRADRLYGSFKMAGFKVGLAWDKSRLKASTASATGIVNVTGNGGVTGAAFASGTTISERTAWSIPVSYMMGKNQFHFHYTKALDDKSTAVQDGGKMVAFSYQYTLSKRTSVGLTYSKITNDIGAAYNNFTSASLGNSISGVNPGEDPRLMAATIRHAF